MRYINMVYDDVYDDVEILLVPDEIAERIAEVVWEFNHWLSVPENRSRFMVTEPDGRKVVSINSKEFIWWLNCVKIQDGQEASVVTKHSFYNPEYPIAEF